MKGKNGYLDGDMAITTMRLYLGMGSEDIERDYETTNRFYKRARDAAISLGKDISKFPKRITKKRIERTNRLIEIINGENLEKK